MGYQNGVWDMGGWLLMAVAMVLFLSAVAWLLVWALRTYLGEQPLEPAELDPDEILARRFALGEIDEEELERRYEVLHALAAGS